MKMIRMLIWSLWLDSQLLFRVKGLPLSGKLALILQKYLRYLPDIFSGAGRRPKSLMVFGSRFCYNEPFSVGSLQRVFCAACGLRELLPEHPVVVDVGANIGQFNFFATKYLGARRVVSIEPVRGSFQLLQGNAAEASNCLCCAVSDREGELLFHVASESSQLSSYLIQPEAGYRESYSVPVRRLDDIADQLGGERVDLLKIDTEGSEFDVLKSAERVLSRTKYVLVEMSVFRECSANLFRIGSFLEEHGFELVELSGGVGKRPADLDALFRKR